MRKVKLNNADIINLFQVLHNLKIKGTAKFMYAMAKNRDMLKSYVMALEAARDSYNDEPKFKEFQKANGELLARFSNDADGNPSVRDDGDGNLRRVIPVARQSEYVKARDALNEAYKDVIEGAQAHQKSFIDLLSEIQDIELRTVKEADIPNDQLTQQEFNYLYMMFDDPEAAEDARGHLELVK